MALMTPEIQRLVGARSDVEVACEPVEPGAVRRHVQACMDDDADYHAEDAPGRARHGGPVAPALFPMTMFRRPFGTPDPFPADDPHFDGIVGSTAQGLPPLPLPPGIGLLNAGTEVELFRYARHGEVVTARSRYVDITEKESSRGPMLIVVIETEYASAAGEPLLKVRKTQIRR